jgi:hypothetical protein
MYRASTKEGTPLKILTGLVIAFLPFAVLAQDGSTGPEERHEDHLVAMQASNPFQSIQPTHEEADAALNGHHIVGAAAEPAGETQTVNFSSSTGDELEVDDAIEQASNPPQSIQPTHEEADATLNGDHIVGAAAEPAREIQSVNFSSSTGDELKVDDAIEQASNPPQTIQPTHEEADAALNGDPIVGAAAEPAGEIQSVNFSASSADELKVDDAIEQASNPPQTILPTHEEADATLNGDHIVGAAAEPAREIQSVNFSTSTADELKVDDAIEQASTPLQSTQPTHEEADVALNADHIVGAAAEPAGEIQTVNFSASSADELKVDDAVEEASISPQSTQPTHEEGAALGGVAELTGENNNAIPSTNGYGP